MAATNPLQEAGVRAGDELRTIAGVPVAQLGVAREEWDLAAAKELCEPCLTLTPREVAVTFSRVRGSGAHATALAEAPGPRPFGVLRVGDHWRRGFVTID